MLGAGFSDPFNIPTMRPFLKSFRKFANRKYPSLQGTLEKHIQKLTDESDIEELLSSLSMAEALSYAMPSPDHMDAELRCWASESRSIKAYLVSYIIEKCEQFDRDKVERDITPFLKHLDSSKKLSEVHFFTTNYDRILEYVSEYTDIALDDGFGTSESELVAPWTGDFSGKMRLYKLHGSVTYYVDRQHAEAREFLRLDRGYPLPDPDFRLSRQGRELQPLMVLPTLEKEAMDDPYGNLMHVFTETLSTGGLVIAMGTSLRDAHLVSAMNYSKDKIVTLVIDNEPELAIKQIPEVKSVPLKADMSECLKILNLPLVKLAEQCAEISCPKEIFDEVSRFAGEQTERLSTLHGISEEQRDQIKILKNGDNEINKIEAIRRLQGLSHPEIIDAISLCLTQEQSPAVRKAAAGSLGLGKNAKAVDVLAYLAAHDNSPDVRLESYLALREIGGNEARKALEVAESNWPEDPFFWEEKRS